MICLILDCTPVTLMVWPTYSGRYTSTSYIPTASIPTFVGLYENLFCFVSKSLKGGTPVFGDKLLRVRVRYRPFLRERYYQHFLAFLEANISD